MAEGCLARLGANSPQDAAILTGVGHRERAREKTRLVHVSRVRPVGSVETVNPPVVRCSTVLYRDIATRREVRARREQGERLFMYGASGTPPPSP